MDNRLNAVLNIIDKEYRDKIQKGSRHYLEVSIGKTAEALGYADLTARYLKTYAIVPLQAPQPGMKVRIDGRTFLDYAEYDTGIAVPGFLARELEREYQPFLANDDMICNFT